MNKCQMNFLVNNHHYSLSMNVMLYVSVLFLTSTVFSCWWLLDSGRCGYYKECHRTCLIRLLGMTKNNLLNIILHCHLLFSSLQQKGWNDIPLLYIETILIERLKEIIKPHSDISFLSPPPPPPHTHKVNGHVSTHFIIRIFHHIYVL